MKNKGLFSSLFIEDLKKGVDLDDAAQGRMATLAQTWSARDAKDAESLWNSFVKQALSYLEFVPPGQSSASGIYPLFEDYSFTACIGMLYLAPAGSDIDDTAVGRFYPAKLLAQLKEKKLNWGILTDGSAWRLYSTKSSRPYEDFVELSLADTLENADEKEYALFERFFHKDSFVPEDMEHSEEKEGAESQGVYKCRLDRDREESEKILEEYVKKPFLSQVDEVLSYICNGFICETKKRGEEYTEEERAEIFESAVKLIYRCLFLFFAEARRLLPTDPVKAELYSRCSIRFICGEARKFHWGERRDTDNYDIWQHLKGLVNAVNEGDPEYGIMGYDGGLFDDEEEHFLGRYKLRNDFISRALYLLAFVEPVEGETDDEYAIPYEDLEVRHLGELYENILEYTVLHADADRIRRRTKKGMEILLASQTTKKPGDTVIKKGDVYFGESALERKQTGSYYTPESLVRFLNEKTIVQPLLEKFEKGYRLRFDDFLEQAKNGNDERTRRGAAQSAVALIVRFVDEEVLNFKVCDPAMGSGHFLVNAANQMTGLVVALLEETPYVEGTAVSATSNPNHWRRLITRHCIYGVDINPLAVNLAKLSLWLNCFAMNHRLTFLDHHVRCGNSLIGIRSLDQLAAMPERKKGSKKKNSNTGSLFPDFKQFAAILAEAGRDVQGISAMDEDETDEQKAVFEKAREKVVALEPLADLYVSYLIDAGIREEDYHTLFYGLARNRLIDNPLNPDLPRMLESMRNFRERHHFFHWPLEFPDMFMPGNSSFASGFSATFGNPPWDIVKPNSQEFFSSYDQKFRSYSKQEANRVAEKMMEENPVIGEKWEKYCGKLLEQSAYLKEPSSYSALGGGDINTYKLFLEQCFILLKNGGRMGIVVPSGLYTDQGAQQLRELFFNHSRVEFLLCFSNERFIFKNVHHAFKFVAFSTFKGGKTDKFKACFLIDPRVAVSSSLLDLKLQSIEKNSLEMPYQAIRKFSPDTLSVMEFKSQRDINVSATIYGDCPLLRDKLDETWNVKLNREFDTSTDSMLFKEVVNDCPLYEGKVIWIYDNCFSPVKYWLTEKDVRKREIQKKWKELSKCNKEPEIFDYMCFRCGFRRIAASTNERTCLSTIIPPMAICPDTTVTVSRLDYDPTLGRAIELISLKESMAFLAFLNSFALDFIIRKKITTHLDMHFMYTLPVPRGKTMDSHLDKFINCIVSRIARLVCVNKDYEMMWTEAFQNEWSEPTFWYASSADIGTYGLVHEQDIRNRLRDEAKNLTPEWGYHCGVHDRLPDRRDTGDRAQLRAEVDAYVAHLYGLSRDDFSYILDTFPVLKKKEEKAFGEFMSKRKCLEEYDRIGRIVSFGGISG